MKNLEFIVYSKTNCPQCDEAMNILKDYVVTKELLDVDFDLKNIKERFPTARSFPIVCVNILDENFQVTQETTHIGDLKALRQWLVEHK